MKDEWDDWFRKGKKFNLIGQHELPGRIRIINNDGSPSLTGFDRLGFSKHKLFGLLRALRENQLFVNKKQLMFEDGTQIFMKEAEGNTRIDIVLPVIGKQVIEEEKEVVRKEPERFPLPVIELYDQEGQITGFFIDAEHFEKDNGAVLTGSVGSMYQKLDQPISGSDIWFTPSLAEVDLHRLFGPPDRPLAKGEMTKPPFIEAWAKELRSWADGYGIYKYKETDGGAETDYWNPDYLQWPDGPFETVFNRRSWSTSNTIIYMDRVNGGTYPGEKEFQLGSSRRDGTGIYHGYNTGQAAWGIEESTRSGDEVSVDAFPRTVSDRDDILGFMWNREPLAQEYEAIGGCHEPFNIPSLTYAALYSYTETELSPISYYYHANGKDYLIYEGMDVCTMVDNEIYKYPRKTDPDWKSIHVFSVQRDERQMTWVGSGLGSGWGKVATGVRWIRYGFIWKDICWKTPWWIIDLATGPSNYRHTIPDFDKGLGQGQIRACQVTLDKTIRYRVV